MQTISHFEIEITLFAKHFGRQGRGGRNNFLALRNKLQI